MNFLFLIVISLVRINFFGDLMPANWVGDILKKYPDSVFVNIDTVLKNVDLNVVNLESPATDTGTPFPDKKYLYKFPPYFISVFKKHNINVFLLANNHMMDYGEIGLNATIHALDAEGVYHAGAGGNLDDASAPLILNRNGFKIGILDFAMTFPLEYYAKKKRAGIAPGYPGNVFHRIRKLRDSVDFLVVSFHFGAEKLDTPKDYQVEMAERCIDNGADLVFGHHPHRVQPIEIYKNRLIFYSLGNFIFGSYSRSANGAFIRAEIKRDSVYYRIYPLKVDPVITGFATVIQKDDSLIEHILSRYGGSSVKKEEDFVSVVLPLK